MKIKHSEVLYITVWYLVIIYMRRVCALVEVNVYIPYDRYIYMRNVIQRLAKVCTTP